MEKKTIYQVNIGNYAHNLINEAIFELYRAHNFPDLPSRLQCLFACDTIEKAISYAKSNMNPELPFDIYGFEVDSYSGPHYDDHLKVIGFAQGFSAANDYWSGTPVKCIPEYLIELPVEFQQPVEKVTIDS